MKKLPWLLIFFIGIKESLLSFVIPPTDGDYSYLYPKVCLGISILENEYVLPYYMGLLENFRYPKDRIHISLYTKTNGSIHRWANNFPKGFYRSIRVTSNDGNWWESALTYSRQKHCDFAFLGHTDSFLHSDSLRQLISLNKIVVSPLMNSSFGVYSNAEGLELKESFLQRDELDFIRVYYSNGPLLINLKHPDSSYLTFSEENIRNYNGNGHPIDVFAFSAFSMDIPILFTNHFFYGHYISSHLHDRSEHIVIYSNFLANQVSDNGVMSFQLSAVLAPWYPVATKLGFDEIYLINLKRRPERLRKMQEVLRLIGMDFKRVEAVDGYNLTEQHLSSINFLPDYRDPYHNRPMKLGEIGCFLSHYKVWEYIVNNGHQRAIVLEDDVRFTQNGTLIIKKMMEDLMKTRLDWDFIYFGRKKMTPPGDEFYVPGHRFLSTVAYSYWTIGYAISFEGAKKLIAARPLDRMIALDEFLPIMYNRHPNKNWSTQFAVKDLYAFAIYPVALEPERYTHQRGYVSDTEASPIVELTNEIMNKHLDSFKDVGKNGQTVFRKDEL